MVLSKGRIPQSEPEKRSVVQGDESPHRKGPRMTTGTILFLSIMGLLFIGLWTYTTYLVRLRLFEIELLEIDQEYPPFYQQHKNNIDLKRLPNDLLIGLTLDARFVLRYLQALDIPEFPIFHFLTSKKHQKHFQNLIEKYQNEALTLLQNVEKVQQNKRLTNFPTQPNKAL